MPANYERQFEQINFKDALASLGIDDKTGIEQRELDERTHQNYRSRKPFDEFKQALKSDTNR